ncbi:MobC family plasmid mobilization relaxosome protein [bacterium AH-315-J04]|nr:MobC family plasmid mobilization relaxosome protein [bacterium AH-315-J04]
MAKTAKQKRPPGKLTHGPKRERRWASTRTDLTYDEKNYLRDQAREAGISEAAYVRRRVLGLPVTVPKPKTDVRLFHELNAIGVNINQIARHLNSDRQGGHTLDWFTVQRELQRVLKKVGAAF